MGVIAMPSNAKHAMVHCNNALLLTAHNAKKEIEVGDALAG